MPGGIFVGGCACQQTNCRSCHLAPLPCGSVNDGGGMCPVSLRRAKDRHLIPGSPVEDPASPLLSYTSPLLEEKWHPLGATLLAYLPHPIRLDRPSAGSTLSTDDDPVDAGKVDDAQGPQQRFQGEKPHCSGYLSKVVRPPQVLGGLNRHAHPHVGRPAQLAGDCLQPLRALGEDLERVPGCP